jgi:EmrB/QacA subfamily drug resistance transporter
MDELVRGPAAPVAARDGTRLVLGVLVSAAFMAQLDMFIVNVAMPAMSKSFAGASLSDLSWVLDAYAVVFASLLIPSGRLADHFGRRAFLLAGIATFTGASLACALSPTLPVLIAARAVQAVGAAMVLPTSLGLMLSVFPADEHNRVVGIWAGSAAVAASAGSSIGGLLVSADWRLIFLVNVPTGALAMLVGVRVLPDPRELGDRKLPDLLSSALLLLAVTLLVLATVQGGVWGWDSAATLATLAGAVVGVLATAARAHTAPRPLVERALFTSREFSRAGAALLFFYAAMAAWLLTTVLFLQDEWRWSPTAVGLGVAPAPLTSAFFAANGGRIIGALGRTVPALLGPLLMAAGALFWLIAAPPTAAYALRFLPGLIISGMGAGLTQAPLFASTATLPPSRSSTGSAVLNTSRQIGSALGVAVLVAILATPRPQGLSEFHRGWLLMLTASLLAGACVALIRPARTRRRADASAPGD